YKTGLLFGSQLAQYPDRVFALGAVAWMHEPVRQVARGRENKQALGVQVEPSDGQPLAHLDLGQARKYRGAPCRIVVADDFARRLMVQNDARRLGSVGPCDEPSVDPHLILRAHPLADVGGFAIDGNPPRHDEFFHFAARADAGVGQHLVQLGRHGIAAEILAQTLLHLGRLVQVGQRVLGLFLGPGLGCASGARRTRRGIGLWSGRLARALGGRFVYRAAAPAAKRRAQFAPSSPARSGLAFGLRACASLGTLVGGRLGVGRSGMFCLIHIVRKAPYQSSLSCSAATRSAVSSVACASKTGGSSGAPPWPAASVSFGVSISPGVVMSLEAPASPGEAASAKLSASGGVSAPPELSSSGEASSSSSPEASPRSSGEPAIAWATSSKFKPAKAATPSWVSSSGSSSSALSPRSSRNCLVVPNKAGRPGASRWPRTSIQPRSSRVLTIWDETVTPRMSSMSPRVTG